MRLIPLRHAADVRTSSVDKHAHDGEIPVRLCNYVDVYRNDKVAPSPDSMLATATSKEIERFRLLRGDTVLTKDSEDPSDIGISAYVEDTDPGFVCGYHLAIARPRSDVHPRYLTWALRSRPALRHLSAHATGISRYGLAISDLGSTPLPWLEIEEQRRVADFLDDRVARIDRIIAARKAQVELATSLPWAGFRHELQASAAQAVPLRRAIAYISDGPFGSAFTSDDYVEEGPAVIRLGNIGFAEFRSPDLARIPDSIYARFPRSAVRAGDLLIASLGDDRNHAGRACIAPAELGPAMVKGKCYVGRPSEVANAEFLALLLSSPLGAEQLVAQGSGATRSMLNFERLLSTVLPVPGRVVQEGLVADFAQARATSAQQTMRLQASIDLLAEYKQSLITAAVTGELDVTTAGSGIPG